MLILTSQYDDNTPNLFTKYALAIEAATYLGIPARDFSEGLFKRLIGIARKKLMTWSEVEYFLNRYDAESPAPEVPDAVFEVPDEGDDVGTKLREIAAYSVFYGWWRGELDEVKTPDDMMFLHNYRKEQPEFDAKLHQIAEQNEKEIRDKWEKKRLEREGGGASGGGEGWDTGDAGTGGGGGGSGWDNDNTTTATGGWDTGDAGDNTASGDWDKENAAPSGASSNWDNPTSATSATSWEAGGETESKEDWADEMNEAAAPSSGPAW
jgi:hypothetical protein